MKKQTTNKPSDCQPRADGSSVFDMHGAAASIRTSYTPSAPAQNVCFVARVSQAMPSLCGASPRGASAQDRTTSQLLQTPCERCNTAAWRPTLQQRALLSPPVILVRNRSSSTPTFVFSQSDAVAKLNFQVDREGETPGKCQNRRSQRRRTRRRRFPVALCHAPWKEGLYDEWRGREARESGGI